MTSASDDEHPSNRRRVLQQLAIIPAAAVLAGCERGAQSAPKTTTAQPQQGRQYVNPPQLLSDEAYSSVVRVGQTVYITAQLPFDEHGHVVPGGPEAQVRQIWKNIEIAMQSVGGKLQDIVMCTTFVTSADYMDPVGVVRVQVFPVNPPATSRPLLVNRVSAIDGVFVSISAIGVITT